MSLNQARRRLRRLYRLLWRAAQIECPGLSSSYLSVVGVRSSPAPGDTSATEAAVFRRADLLRSVAAEVQAFRKLGPDQRRFCALRYGAGGGLSLRRCALRMGWRLTGMREFERLALSAFIAALGRVPRED